ncbi:MAG: phosphoenolpyruvate--protein phosphotransferase [Mycoplasmataceae bacterium]|nr:phosphoenolpyruvate--protein phosphotransferase [Mycoplasmataceae bacterium]
MKTKGIGASEGIYIAKAFVMNEEKVNISDAKVKDTNKEIIRFSEAKKTAEVQISELMKVAKAKLGEEKAAVFGAHLQIVNDPSIAKEVETLIKNSAVTAVYALDKIANNYISMFEQMDDPYMKERAADIKDVTTRIIKIMAGIEIMDLSTISEEVIIIADDLSPSQTAQMNVDFVKGFATNIGGKTSHSAIMARTLEVPAVVGLRDITSKVKNGEIVIIDGQDGIVINSPSSLEVKRYRNKISIENEMKHKLKEFSNKTSQTKDGHKFEIAGNIGNPHDVDQVLVNGGEAIGLFRSEFLYMDASSWPNENDQYEAYKSVVQKMGNKKVIIRTLDIGGDKKLDYFTFPHEDNPFLGYRATRFTMDRKEVFSTQIRALLRAAVHGNLYVNLPMIATVQEFLNIKEFVELKKKELKKEKIPFGDIKLGIMVEIPSVAMLADKFAKHADFFSVGTNDLIQYTFAADRLSEKVSYLYQPYNPSILRMLKNVIDASHKEGKFTAMCGEMAGSIDALPLLLGLGLDEFSMSSSSILKIRYYASKMNHKDTIALANKALDSSSNEEVVKLVSDFYSKINL